MTNEFMYVHSSYIMLLQIFVPYAFHDICDYFFKFELSMSLVLKVAVKVQLQ